MSSNKNEIISSSKKDYKNIIIEQLNEVLKQRKKKNVIWAIRAYNKALESIKLHEDPIYNSEDLENIKGLGKSIKEKIQEIFDNGIVTELSELSEENVNQSKVLEQLANIAGIGDVKANDLYTKHNIRSIEDLKNNQHLLNNKQVIGLKYFNDIQIRIPRAELIKHEKLLKSIVDKYSNVECEIAGSYRRLEKTSGDIDILITHKNDDISVFKNIIDELIQSNYIKDIMAYGKKKFMGFCKLKNHKITRRIDILYTAPVQYPFALLYFTGSHGNNVIMRVYALSKGYSLSEYGLTYSSGPKKGQYVDHPFRTEKDIYDFLKLKYVKPEDRKQNIKLVEI